MRRLVFLLALLSLIAAPVSAQTPMQTPSASPNSQPPAMVPLDESVEPQVTIKQREGETVEEYRLNGRLYKITVTPEHGVPYTLIDPSGEGSFVPVDGPGTPKLSVPTWVIGTF